MCLREWLERRQSSNNQEMGLYNLWLHHRLCVCFPSCTFSHPQPSMHFVLQGGNEMRAPLQFLFFHKVRQGATGREINCLWLSRDPQNAAVSLSSVQKWLWVFWFRLVWYGSLFNQFVKSLEQEFNAYRTLKVLPLATVCLSSSCFTLYCHFCSAWQILWTSYPHSRKSPCSWKDP